MFSRDLTIFPAHPHVHPQSEWAIPDPAFPAIAGTRLPTPEEHKAELAWLAGYIARQVIYPKAVTHPTTNRAVEQLRWSRPRGCRYTKPPFLAQLACERFCK